MRAHHWPVNQLVFRLALRHAPKDHSDLFHDCDSFEAYNHYRHIFLDGCPLREPIQPAYMGYSVGKCDNDTLVVETTGFNDRGWLDDGGHPQTESLHVTERFQRTNFGHISLQLTIDDARIYTKPWTVNLSGFNFLGDEELMESICENEKDVPHMVGK
jgi:hypothetical protein